MSERDSYDGSVESSDDEDFKPLSEMTVTELKQRRNTILAESSEPEPFAPNWPEWQERLLQVVTGYKNLETLISERKVYIEGTTADGSTIYIVKDPATAPKHPNLPDWKSFLTPRPAREALKAGTCNTDDELRKDITRLEAEVRKRADTERQEFKACRTAVEQYNSARTELYFWLKEGTFEKVADGGYRPSTHESIAGRGGMYPTVTMDSTDCADPRL